MKKPYLLLLLIIPIFLLSACGSSTTTPGSATLRKGPYLVYPNETTSMVVMWQSNATPTVNKIEWGATTAYGNSATTTESSALAAEHLSQYKISSLAPATKYYYKLTVDSQVSAGSFCTASGGSEKNLTFYASSDHHGTAQQNTVHNAMLTDLAGAASRQTFCLNAGDLNDDSEDEDNWDDHFFNKDYSSTWEFLRNIPVLSGLGNHDTYHADFSPAAKPGELVRKYWPLSYYATADRSYYSFDWGPAHVVVLDQYNDNYAYTLESSAQYTWLQSDLSANTRPWLFVMFHQPAWTASLVSGTGSHGNNTDIQDHLCPLFKTYDVDLVIQGHEHYYARVEPTDGIVYLTLGGGGGIFGTPDTSASYLKASAKTYHFARFDIVDNTMEVTVINDSGAAIDSFTVTN
jgi:hypothetical protein